MNHNRLFILLGALSLTTLSGCFQNAQVRGVMVIPAETHRHTTTTITHYGPPPYAPANGYRYHHHNHDLQYDSGFGAYIVIGSPGLYFYDDYYMRFYDGVWQITTRIGRPWYSAPSKRIPYKLRKRHAQRHHAEEHREEKRHNRLKKKRLEQIRHEKKHQRHNARHDEHHDAPQHGYRRHYHGHELVYDTGIGVYRIVKRPGIYFYKDHYFRQHRGKWQTANKLSGSWKTASKRHIPGKLRKARLSKKGRHDSHDEHDERHKRWGD